MYTLVDLHAYIPCMPCTAICDNVQLHASRTKAQQESIIVIDSQGPKSAAAAFFKELSKQHEMYSSKIGKSNGSPGGQWCGWSPLCGGGAK